jgi:hypothetical protein
MAAVRASICTTATVTAAESVPFPDRSSLADPIDLVRGAHECRDVPGRRPECDQHPDDRGQSRGAPLLLAQTFHGSVLQIRRNRTNARQIATELNQRPRIELGDDTPD